MYACSLSCVLLFVTLWVVACQAPLFMGFSRQEYWSGLPYPPPGDLPDLRIEPESLTSPALEGRFFTTSATWEAPRRVYSTVVSYHSSTWRKQHLGVSVALLQFKGLERTQIPSSSLRSRVSGLETVHVQNCHKPSRKEKGFLIQA